MEKKEVIDETAGFRAARIGWNGENMPAHINMGEEKNSYFATGGNGLLIEMVFVPPGDFIMGSDEHEDTSPKHVHKMPEGYYIAKYPTTWREYRAFCADTGYKLPETPPWETGDDIPVTNVSWHDAKAFCDWVGMDLPSEAQWEKAARGENGNTYPWGEEEPTPERCVARSGNESPLPVGPEHRLLGASPYGARDMVGNIMEWCEDPYDKDAYRKYVEENNGSQG